MTTLLQWKWQFSAPIFGVLMTLAFAPYDFSYLAPIALVFFYVCCARQTSRQAAVSGYLFGLGLFGSGIWWVYISIHDYGGAEPVFAGLLTLLLVALWAVFPALTAYLSARIFTQKGIWFRITAAGLLWVVVEYVRGNGLLNGFPWLQIAYSQIRTPLAGYAPVMGVYGVGFLMTVSACILFECWRNNTFRLQGVLVLTVVWGTGWGLQHLQWTHAIGDPIKLTLVQGNIDQEQKWQNNHKSRTLALYKQFTEQYWDSNVVIWPETSVPAFLSEVKAPFLEPLSAEARQHGVDMVISLPTEGGGKDYYNSVMTLGRTEALYHKRHLLPFGEYLPLQPLSGWVLDQLNIPLGSFTAGAADQPLLTAGGYAFVTTICYEDAFGELVRRQVEQAAYIVNVTNDAWFGDTAEPYQHMQLAQMRALETGRYLARATNTGLTGFVLPNGRISQQAPLFETTALTGTIVPMTGLTPYARFGDKGVFAGLLVLLMLAFWGAKRA